jgi:hypothetical protein
MRFSSVEVPLELMLRRERAEYLRMLCIHAQSDGRSLFRRRPEKSENSSHTPDRGNIQFRRVGASGKGAGKMTGMVGSRIAPKCDPKAVHDCIPMRIRKSVQLGYAFRKTKIIHKSVPQKENAPKYSFEAFFYKRRTGSCVPPCAILPSGSPRGS